MTLTTAAVLVGAVVTLAVLATPYVDFGYRNPSLHLVLDTVDACIALLLAYLMQGRYSRLRRLQDALLTDGLLLLGVAGLGLTLLLGLVRDVVPSIVGVWLPLVLRLVAALLIAAAACVGERVMTPRGRALRLVPWLAVAVAVPLLWFTRDLLPVALEQRSVTGETPVLAGHPALLAAHAVSAVAFLLAATVFTMQARHRPDDPLVGWLGAAFALAAFGRLNYLLFPSMYTGWLFTGDVLRTSSYAVLLIGAAREIGRYWSAQARAAVLEDRRRLARELHDGVVQELSYIRSEAVSAGAVLPTSDRIVEACDRGLDEARAAVEALGSSAPDEPLGYVLHRAARQVAERYGAQVVVDLDDAVQAGQEQRHALVRITREAVSNSIRHGGATITRIRLARGPDHSTLVVTDDGSGFAVDGGSDRGGYGLTSMRERALALPGRFELTSEPGRGTEVVVTW